MTELLIPGRPTGGADGPPFGRRFFADHFREGEAPACKIVADGQMPVVRLQLVNGESLDVFCFERFTKQYLIAQIFVDPGECDEFYQTFLPYEGIFRVNLHHYPTPENRLGFKPTNPDVDDDDD